MRGTVGCQALTDISLTDYTSVSHICSKRNIVSSPTLLKRTTFIFHCTLCDVRQRAITFISFSPIFGSAANAVECMLSTKSTPTRILFLSWRQSTKKKTTLWGRVDWASPQSDISTQFCKEGHFSNNCRKQPSPFRCSVRKPTAGGESLS